MNSDYVDNWDALPLPIQEALAPIILDFDAGADLLFDRRLNLSFEAAIRELSVPGIVFLTQGLRALGELLRTRVTVADAAEGALRFDDQWSLTAYDLPFYTPCVYLSQLAQYQDAENVRVWKEATATEIVAILVHMAQYIRPDIETARVAIAALHDMVLLYPAALPQLQAAADTKETPANAQQIASLALHLLKRRMG